jgi:hypothetical protein
MGEGWGAISFGSQKKASSSDCLLRLSGQNRRPQSHPSF